MGIIFRDILHLQTAGIRTYLTYAHKNIGHLELNPPIQTEHTCFLKLTL
jgi:pyruvate carboxylase